jgi:hypothetical protein
VGEHETMFLIVGLFAHQILRSIGSQIEMETIFSLKYLPIQGDAICNQRKFDFCKQKLVE